MEQKSLDALIVAQAMYKRLGKLVSTKPKGGETSLRSELDEHLRKIYEEHGADRIDLEFCGMGVGSVSLQFADATERHGLTVTDPEAFDEWLHGEDGVSYVWAVAEKHKAEILSAASANGECPDGCKPWTESLPRRVTKTRMVVDEDKVLGAITGELPPAYAAMLGDGE